MDLLFHAAGTNAIHSTFHLERHFRDIHVAVTHAAGLDRNIELGGKTMLGSPEATGWYAGTTRPTQAGQEVIA